MKETNVFNVLFFLFNSQTAFRRSSAQKPTTCSPALLLLPHAANIYKSFVLSDQQEVEQHENSIFLCVRKRFGLITDPEKDDSFPSAC